MGVGGIVEAVGGAGYAGAAGDDVAAVVATFAQEAVAGGDVVHAGAPVQALGVARLDAEHAVVTRLHGQLGVGGVDQRAGAAAFVVIGQHLELAVGRQRIGVAQVDAGAVALPEIGGAGVLERIGLVLGAGQAARGQRTHIVVGQFGAQFLLFVDGIGELQREVVEAVIAALAPAAPVLARVEQRRAQTVAAGAAEEGVVLGAVTAAMVVGAVAHTRFAVQARAGRNGAGAEVDDAAHVLWAVAHRAAAAHHVDRFDVGQAGRCERQLWLAIRRHRQRHAVQQYGRARRVAPGQAAHADVQRDRAAGRAGVVGDLHAGDAAHGIADAGCATGLDALAVDHRARAGEALDAVMQAGAQPAAGNLDAVQRGGAVLGEGTGGREQAQGEGGSQGQAGRLQGVDGHRCGLWKVVNENYC